MFWFFVRPKRHRKDTDTAVEHLEQTMQCCIDQQTADTYTLVPYSTLKDVYQVDRDSGKDTIFVEYD